jgi:hypothetical protein
MGGGGSGFQKLPRLELPLPPTDNAQMAELQITIKVCIDFGWLILLILILLFPNNPETNRLELLQAFIDC